MGVEAAILGAGALGLAGSYFGGKEASKGAKEAAAIQAEGGRDAIEILRQDLAPFTQLGSEAAGMLMGNVLQPDQAQVTAQDVLSDPFYQALADEQQQSLLAERAALGLAGSGGTQDVLQRNLLQLGEGFRQQKANGELARQQARFNQLFGIAGLGQASAAQTGMQSAGLLTDIASAQSAVPLASAQAKGNLYGSLADFGGLAMGVAGGLYGGSQIGAGSAVGGMPSGMTNFSDARLKNNIVKVGSDEFGGVYEFSYNGVIGRYRGRIAQELQSIKPDAVSIHENGYLQVADEFRSELV